MASPEKNRFELIDIVRGLAVFGMIIFHFFFDLTLFGYASFQIGKTLGWIVFNNIISSSFLLLVGYSMGLADLSPKKFLKRIFRVGVCAALLSVSTYFIYPNYWIYFGILHCIAVCMVITYPFARYPRHSLTMGILLLILFAFIWHDWVYWYHEHMIHTLDFQPIFPNIAFVFLGIYLSSKKLHLYYQVNFPGKTVFAMMGRHALIIYMIHQPLLYSLFYLVQ
ncbi:TPA: DUF1624 domain-containing protein [Legionella pneumophila]|nr:DUF1624 domain-containing protein [Legionella pneumophila]HEM6985640.1 DUF1624 domain-containing protein [Legionella pneumophila]HEM7058427.1 DUF1624 domain-containing protein [Legionella pneumophila]